MIVRSRFELPSDEEGKFRSEVERACERGRSEGLRYSIKSEYRIRRASESLFVFRGEVLVEVVLGIESTLANGASRN